MSLTRVWMPSPNFYQGNSGQRLLVIHSSEGSQTYQSLGNYFANPSVQASSHVGIDDKVRGTIGEYVQPSNSAWTAAGANEFARQAELCTPNGASANWSRSDWLNHGTMLQNLADWLKEESKATGIPLIILTDAQAQGNGRGVCQHRNLGAWGGGHVDCGPNFPIDHVISLAKGTTTSYIDWDERMGQLILDSTKKCVLVFPNEVLDGKHKIRFGCRTNTDLRIDGTGDTATIQLRGGPLSYGLLTSDKMITVKVDAGGDSPIGYAISED